MNLQRDVIILLLIIIITIPLAIIIGLLVKYL